MRLPSGTELVALLEETYALDESDDEAASQVWEGAIVSVNERHLDLPGLALFVVSEDRVAGQLSFEAQSYDIMTVEAGGAFLLAERDFRALPTGDDTPTQALPIDPEDLLSPEPGEAPSAPAHIPSTPGTPSVGTTGRGMVTNTIVRVLQIATPEATNAIGGRATMRDRLRFFLAQANNVYRGNAIPLRVRNAGFRFPGGGQGTNNSQLILNRLSNTRDGRLYDTLAAGARTGNGRNGTRADIVAIVVNRGLFIPFGGRNFSLCGQADAIAANAGTAFFNIRFDCTTFTWVHELGHLFGARHDNDPTRTPFAYGHGFVNSGGNFRTVMAVNSNPQPRIGRFSTDDQTFRGGALGNRTFSDNERVHFVRRRTMAGFR